MTYRSLFRPLFRQAMFPALLFIFVFLSFASIVTVHAAEPPNEATGNQIDTGGVGGRFLSEASDRMQQITEQLSEAGQGILAVPEWIKSVFDRAQDPDILRTWAEMGGKVVLVLIAGILAGWGTRRLLNRFRRRVEDSEGAWAGRRVMLMTVRTLIDIFPLAAFAVVAYAVLPLTDPRYETRLVALALVNATIIVRFIMIAARAVLAPDVPALRLLPIGDESVHYLHIWLRRVAGIGLYGFFILEAALLMGIPGGLYVFLSKFLGLAVTAMLLILVMQNRNEVSGWLRHVRPLAAEPPAETHPETPDEDAERLDDEKTGPGRLGRMIAAFMRRFADFWHVAAIFIIIVVFAAWALEVEGGLAYLAAGLALTLLVLVLTVLVTRLVGHGVDRLFQISDKLKTAYPGLEERANRYHPFMRNVLNGVVCIVAVFAILEAWGLGTLGWLFSPAGGAVVGELVTLALIIGVAFLLWEIVSAMIERSLAHEAAQEDGSTRKMTLLPLLRSVARITLLIIASMILLSQLGINIGPLLAGFGVIGLAIGFGAQSLVRDVITGAFILLEDGISVGDWVEAGGYSGTAEHLTVRTVTLRDLAGTVHKVPFGEVTTVTNYNRDYGYVLVDARVAHGERYGEVVQALQDVADWLRGDDIWGPYITGDLELFGLNNVGDSAIEIRVRMKTLPMRQFGVRRAFLERMKHVFDERGIEIPFPHRTIWFGAGKDGTAPPMYHTSVDQSDIEPSGLEESGREPEPEQRVKVSSESEASEEVVQEAEDSEPDDASTDDASPDETKDR